MTAILGLSAFYHDSAAALVIDGEIVAAAQEERFTRIKHDYRFPQHAIDYCLDEAGLTPVHLAARNGDVECLKMLLAAKANVVVVSRNDQELITAHPNAQV